MVANTKVTLKRIWIVSTTICQNFRSVWPIVSFLTGLSLESNTIQLWWKRSVKSSLLIYVLFKILLSISLVFSGGRLEAHSESQHSDGPSAKKPRHAPHLLQSQNTASGRSTPVQNPQAELLMKEVSTCNVHEIEPNTFKCPKYIELGYRWLLILYSCNF